MLLWSEGAADNLGEVVVRLPYIFAMGRFTPRILIALLTLTWSAYGHAIVLSATPAQRQEVAGPDVPVNLRFNSRLDLKRSKLTLVMPDGKQVALPLSESGASERRRARSRCTPFRVK